jgi:8-oxo-dGTP diphosphatase
MDQKHSNAKPIIKAASACVWRGEEVLLVQRGKAWGRGLWTLPGGAIEHGETAQQASARELLEETGIRADLKTHVGDFDLVGDEVEYIISCYTGFWSSGEAVARTDAMAVRWVHWQDLASLKVSFGNDTAILRARQLLSL